MFVSKKKYTTALEQIQKLEELLKIKTEELEYHEQVSFNIKELENRQLKLNNDIETLNYKKESITQDIKQLNVISGKLRSDINKIEDQIQQKNESLGLLSKAEETIVVNNRQLNIQIDERKVLLQQFEIQIENKKNELKKWESFIEDKEIMYKKYFERNQEVEIQKLGILEFTSKFDTPITYLQHSIDNIQNRVNNKTKLVNLIAESKLLTKIDQETSIENILHCAKNLILLTYQNEVELIMLRLKRGNIENIYSKMHHAFKNVNDFAYCIGYQISKEYHEIMLEDLELIYRGILLKHEEKERLRALREEELERKRVEKEIKDKMRELLTREKYLIKEKTSIEEEIKLQGQQQRLILKLNELQDALGLVQKKRDEIERRESISTSGYVYIISNIGSFGEGIYKIGMTRRLDPLERIRELSSASVPFEFDVHAMILTDDAPKLENELHKILHKQRVNLINNRKEFFYVDLEKIKHAIVELVGTDVIFNDKPKATQYFETLFIKQQLLVHGNSDN